MGKPQNWENSRYRSNFKFLDVIFDKIWLKVNLILNRNFVLDEICHEKTESGAKMLPFVQNKIKQFKFFGFCRNPMKTGLKAFINWPKFRVACQWKIRFYDNTVTSKLMNFKPVLIHLNWLPTGLITIPYIDLVVIIS